MATRNAFLLWPSWCIFFFLLAILNQDAKVIGFQFSSVASSRLFCHITEDGKPFKFNPAPTPRMQAPKSGTKLGATWMPRYRCNGRNNFLRVLRRNLLASTNDSYWKSSSAGVRQNVLRRIQHVRRLVQRSTIVQALSKACVVRSKTDNYMKPWLQLAIVLLFYVFHMTVLTQNALSFPVQLFPNERGWFLSVGYDSLAGIVSLLSYLVLSKARNRRPKINEITSEEIHSSVRVGPATQLMRYTALPPLLEDPYYDNLPWNVTTYRAEAWRVLSSKNLSWTSPGAIKEHHKSNDGDAKDLDCVVSEPASLTREELQVLEDVEEIADSAKFTGLFLVVGYTLTGQIASMCEGFLYCLAGLGVPMSIAMHRALVVLISHLCWVFAGSTILSSDLYPSFFGPDNNNDEKKTRPKTPARLWPWERTQNTVLNEQNGQEMGSVTTTTIFPKRPQLWRNTTSEWFTNKLNTSWVWWVIGGYFVSSWCFNLSDILNQLILPARIFENSGEGVVAQLINPEQNDFLAILVGYIAPCLSAPIWEELLYRGYMLPALSLFVPFWPAVFTSGLLFSVHHMSTAGFIPLWVLGMTWATLYAKCKNLWVTILIHAMWNSRVFLGSWLGL